MPQPVYFQFRKYPVRSGTYASCQTQTKRLVQRIGPSRTKAQKANGAERFQLPNYYSGITSPEPPNSFGKSRSLVTPSRIGKTVSA